MIYYIYIIYLLFYLIKKKKQKKYNKLILIINDNFLFKTRIYINLNKKNIKKFSFLNFIINIFNELKFIKNNSNNDLFYFIKIFI